MTPTDDGYPTPAELRRIDEWPAKDPRGLVGFLSIIWRYGSWGLKVKGTKVLQVELHTGGWSGNEEIIEHLQKTMFWYLSWQKSVRGGHYYLKVPVRLLEGMKVEEKNNASEP